MLEAIFEAVLEIVLTPILEPIEEWITRITDKKTKKYNKLLRNLIKVIVFVFFICIFIIVSLSYLQRADLITPIFSAAFVNVCLIINTLFFASMIFFNAFNLKIKRQKYVVIPVSIIVFIFNVIFLIST